MKSKDKKAGKSKTSDALRQMREKSSKPQKVSKEKTQEDKALAVLPELKKAASTLVPLVIEGVTKFSNALSDAVKLDSQIQEVREKELWRYTETPYKSWTAFVQELKSISGKSAATLFGIIGLQKALPGTTAEQRRKIGPRKGAKIAKAAKVAAKKGEVLPLEIIEKAASGATEEEVIHEIRVAGLEEQKPEPFVSTQGGIQFDPLLAKSETNTLPEPLKRGGSGVVEGQHSAAAQFNGRVQEAMDCARLVYRDPSQAEVTDFSSNLKFVCNLWLESTCERNEYLGRTNAEALASYKKRHGLK